jgi:2-hydroxy-3-keto-5-methylthiopentenyl-1-phosphate phosphatase
VRVVLDWDGTVTVEDTLHLLLLEFGDRELYERVERELHEDRMSYRELMETEMRTIRVPLEAAREFLLERAEIRPGLNELARAHDVLILSSGFAELIDPLLAREGVQAEVAANRLDPRPDGWRIRWRDDAQCAHCGDLCKRGGLPGDGGPVVYVGDGYSDRCAALAADRVFARDGLARYLERRGVAFEAFGDLHDVASSL